MRKARSFTELKQLANLHTKLLMKQHSVARISNINQSASDTKPTNAHSTDQDRFRMLYEICAINSSDTDAQLDATLRIATDIFGMGIGIISRIENQTYTVENSYHPEGAIQKGDTFELASTYCEITLRKDQVVAMHHIGNSDFASHPCYRGMKLEAYIGIKIIVDHQVFGTLNFSSLSALSQPFSAEDIRMMQIMGAWVSNIIASQQHLTALRESEAQYKGLVENGMAYLCVHDMNGFILQLNKPAIEELGYEPEELVGENLKSFLVPSAAVEFDNYLTRLANQRSDQGVMALLSKSGTICYWSYKNTVEDNQVLGFAQDVTDQVIAEQALIESEHSLREAQSLAKLGSWNHDLASGKTTYSEEMYRILEMDQSREGLSVEEYFAIMHPDDRDEFEAVLKEAITNNQPYTMEHRAILPPHTVKHLLAHGRPITDRYGKVVRIIGALQDVTTQVKKDQEIRKAKEIAEKAARVKQEFLANMSHEIRTPMNAILGFSRLLLRSDLLSDQREYAQSIYESADTLLVVINDILDFSKIEAGKLAIEQVHFNLRKQLNLLSRLFSVKVDEGSVRLLFDTDPKLPEALVGDPVRIYQIINNLVSNAIKFTERGHVKVTTTVVHQEHEQCKVQISVQDTGIGIASDKLETIFESFSQEKGDTTRRYGGTGLGLSIVKRLVALMKGEITATSQEGAGSVFTVTFPLSVGDVARIQSELAPIDSLSLELLENCRILLAEDNRNNQILAKKFLTDVGCQIDIAANGQEAVEKVRDTAYDVVLMDIQMPMMDGIQATQAIRKFSGASGKIPIIAMTAHALKEEENSYRRQGMNEYISKPFDPRQLYATLLKVLCETTPDPTSLPSAGSGDSPEVRPEPRALTANTEQRAMDTVNLNYFGDLSETDSEFIITMLTIFLEDVPTYTEQLYRTFSEQDWQSFKRTAHALKSSISFLEMNHLSDAITEVERTELEKVEQEVIANLYDYICRSCEKATQEVVQIKSQWEDCNDRMIE